MSDHQLSDAATFERKDATPAGGSQDLPEHLEDAGHRGVVTSGAAPRNGVRRREVKQAALQLHLVDVDADHLPQQQDAPGRPALQVVQEHNQQQLALQRRTASATRDASFS